MQKTMKNLPIYKILFLLLPLVSGMPFAMDMYIPAIPIMLKEFNTSVGLMQVTLSIFIFVTGAGQLFIGPITDAFGRKTVILASVAMFTLGQFLCTISTNIEFFIFSRAFAAAGSCGMYACSFAVVRDLYDGDKMGQIFSYLFGTIALSPLFAPMIGGFILYYIDYRAIFWFLVLLGVYGFIMNAIFLKETHDHENRIKLDQSFLQKYLSILKHREFVCYAICATLGLSAIFLFFSESPYLIINRLGYGSREFGLLFGLNGLGMFVGNVVTGRMILKIGIYMTGVVGSLLLLISGITMLLWYYLSGLTILSLIVPSIMAWFSVAMMLSAGGAGSIHPFPKLAGMATSLQGCMTFVIGAIFGAVVASKEVTTNLSLAWSFTFLGLLPLLLFIIFRDDLYYRKKKDSIGDLPNKDGKDL